MTRKALLVGINNYEMDGCDLNGCVNDVEDMFKVTRNFLIMKNTEVRVLANRRATKKAILHRLNWLVDGIQPGDLIIFHFSGHGSQILDRDGDELEDHLDELICPHDMDWDGCYITDDDLWEIFRCVPDGALSEVFLDCCHSGDGTRGMRGGLKNSRYLQPPIDIESRSYGADLSIKAIKKPLRNHVLWSACRSDQTAADAYINRKYHGAFTHFLTKHLYDKFLSRSDLLGKIRLDLKKDSYSQIPQLAIGEGISGRSIFSI